MTTSEHADQASSIPTSHKVLCVAYAVIAVAALIATGIQNLVYLDEPARYLNFMNDLKVTPASRLFTADALLLGLAVALLMIVEARKHGIKFVWLYIAGGLAIAISVTFPLFLIARELRMGTSDAPRFHTTDRFLLAVVAALILGLTIWVNVR